MRLLAVLACMATTFWLGAAEAGGTHGPHEHAAPHGGTLVVLGDEFAHVELVLEAAAGELTAYVLDGEAIRGIPIPAPSLRIDVRTATRPAFSVALEPVENVLTGETRGHTSQFMGRSDDLAGLRAFRGEIVRIDVRGQRFEQVSFAFPDEHEAHEEDAEESS